MILPIIFASSIVSLVPTILALCGVNSATKGFWGGVSKVLASDGIVYPVSLFLLIIAFAYFYTQISFDPVEVSNNIKKNGGTIPGIRQGRPTTDYIKKILNKITLVGALFLGIVAVLPVIAGPHILHHIIHWLVYGSEAAQIAEEYLANSSMSWYAQYYLIPSLDAQVDALTSAFTFGGTSLLIIVGVAIETFRELEAQLTMRNYKGFLN